MWISFWRFYENQKQTSKFHPICCEVFRRRAGEDADVHLHPLCECRHEPLHTASIVRRKGLEELEAIFQSFKQDTLGSILLDRSHGLLDLSHLSPGNLIAHELRFELAE